jgi:hypothetical protein
MNDTELNLVWDSFIRVKGSFFKENYEADDYTELMDDLISKKDDIVEFVTFIQEEGQYIIKKVN